MAHFPVAEFVREDGFDFFDFGFLDESVVDDNFLLPGQAGEVGVAVRAALAAVDDVELVQRELELLGERLDALLEIALDRKSVV